MKRFLFRRKLTGFYTECLLRRFEHTPIRILWEYPAPLPPYQSQFCKKKKYSNLESKCVGGVEINREIKHRNIDVLSFVSSTPTFERFSLSETRYF